MPEAIEAFPIGANIHVESSHIFDTVVNRLVGVLDGIHATETGAVRDMPPVTRTHAKHEQDITGCITIGRAPDLAPGRPRRLDQSFKLQGGEDIRMSSIAVFAHQPGIESIVTRSHDNCPYIDNDITFSRHPKI